MNGLVPVHGLNAEDLDFLTAHVRDTALATGLNFSHLPMYVAAMRDACLTLREFEDGRLRALGLAIDRGVEREVVAVVVQPAARGRGIARRLLDGLVQRHVASHPKNVATSSVWPGVPEGAGLLMHAGFETSAGAVRFERGVEALTCEFAAPALRWLDAEREPEEKRKRLVAAAAAAYPGYADLLPTLASLAAARGGFLTVGFAGNEARVVAVGHDAGPALHVVALYAAEPMRDHAAAEHALERLIGRAVASGKLRLVIESARPVVRTVKTLFRCGFRATDAAAGFRLGPIPARTPAHVFAL